MIRRAMLYGIALLGVVVLLAPFLWTLSTSLKTRQQVYSQPAQMIPTTFWWQKPGAAEALQVAVRETIREPAVLISPTQGTRQGQIIALRKVVWDELGGRVKLRALPDPVEAKLIEDRPAGVAEISILNPPEGRAQQTLFVSPAEITERADPQFSNYREAWNAFAPVNFGWFVLNTFTITLIAIIGQTLSCSLVAYGFARFRFRGRKPLFLLLLSTMMLPSQVTLIPVFLIGRKLGMIDTFGPLTLPAWFAQSAFSIFLLRQFFMTIPRDLDEAAMIDGCGPLRFWWQILMPLSKPAITTVAVLGFIAHWDDFFGPLIYLSSLPKYTVSLALRLYADQQQTEIHLLMAAALIHIAPVLVLFFIAQRYFVKGVAVRGIGGET